MPASEYASVGPGREDAALGGNDAKSVNMETRPHHCHRELRSTTLGGLTSADFRVVVGEQRQKWDSLQGTWEHCTLDPISLNKYSGRHSACYTQDGGDQAFTRLTAPGEWKLEGKTEARLTAAEEQRLEGKVPVNTRLDEVAFALQ